MYTNGSLTSLELVFLVKTTLSECRIMAIETCLGRIPVSTLSWEIAQQRSQVGHEAFLKAP